MMMMMVVGWQRLFPMCISARRCVSYRSAKRNALSFKDKRRKGRRPTVGSVWYNDDYVTVLFEVVRLHRIILFI